MNDPKLLNAVLAKYPAAPHRKARRTSRRWPRFSRPPDADYITGATMVVDGGLLWNYSEQ